MNLEGGRALVTGASVRVGKALAMALAERGAKVIIHYNRSAAAAEAVVSQIKAAGGEALALQADLSQPAAPGQLVADAVEALGGLEILINSAAIFERGTALDETLENWERHFAINLRAPFFLCQAFARQLPSERRGHVINVSDWRAIRPGTAYMAYTMTKSALLTMTKSLAKALGPNIQVNALAPGAILPASDGEDGYFERLAERLPLKHTGNPDDVVHAVLYLLSADFVTGDVLFVTGGEHL